jgi:hypothetical protein
MCTKGSYSFYGIGLYDEDVDDFYCTDHGGSEFDVAGPEWGKLEWVSSVVEITDLHAIQIDPAVVKDETPFLLGSCGNYTNWFDVSLGQFLTIKLGGSK